MDKYADLRDALASDAYIYRSTEIRALLAERDAFKYALEMIAGIRPCADTLMGNADIARAALAQGQEEA